MCYCNPSLRTPCCGAVDCIPELEEKRIALQDAYTLYCAFTNCGNPDATCYSFYEFTENRPDLCEKWLTVLNLKEKRDATIK